MTKTVSSSNVIRLTSLSAETADNLFHGAVVVEIARKGDWIQHAKGWSLSREPGGQILMKQFDGTLVDEWKAWLVSLKVPEGLARVLGDH